MKNLKIFLLIFFTSCIAIRPTERIEFTAPDAYPEGVAYDSAANVYYVSSARTGTVAKVTPDGTYSAILADSTLRSTYGMKMHPDGKRLFVCVSDANYSKFSTPATRQKLARLISLDPVSGKKLSDIDLSGLAPGPHFANDLTFDDKNNIYITDSYADVIYKVSADGKASVFSSHELFKTEGIGINGIVYHPRGFLLVDNTGTGAICKVDINNPTSVQKVKINQFFIGSDGMLLSDTNMLTVVVNGGNEKIYKLKSDDNWQSARLAATTLIADRFTYPSTATRAGQDVWIMNAKFHDLNDSNAIPSKIFAIQKAVFKPIPKKLAEE
jgi:DNA-binding beta-propeller fold protein YncE